MRIHRVPHLARVAAGRLRSTVHRTFGATIDAKTTMGRHVRIDRPSGVRVGARVTFEADVWMKLVSDQATVAVGDFTFVGRGTEFDVTESVVVGSHVLIGPGVFITDHNHGIEHGLRVDEQICAGGPVVIGDDVWLGAGVVILPGVTVGQGAVIGAGAVVTRDIPDWSVCAGVPARIMRKRTRKPVEGDTGDIRVSDIA